MRRRRWFGTAFLLAAIAMLVAGETALKGRLSAVGFLAYWLVCFGFTGLAMVVAFIDLRAVRSRIRDEQRDLIETTLKEIEDKSAPRVRRSR